MSDWPTGRRRPVKIGAPVLILRGEEIAGIMDNPPHMAGYIVVKPRIHCRFITGEFGIVTQVMPKDDKYACQVRLPPHPDFPDDVPRLFYFRRDEIEVLENYPLRYADLAMKVKL